MRAGYRGKFRLMLIGVGLGIGLLSSGCQQKLFPEETPRSPYERYMKLRGRERPATVTDAFGVERPNLWERLQPLDR